MMKRKLTALMLAAAMMLCSACAVADAALITGTVVNVLPLTMSADLGGRVREVLVDAGDAVHAGDVLAVLEGTEVCALQDGTLHWFGETGDSAEMVTERYGAVAYIEPASALTVSASTKNAYNEEENKIIHPGETVYLKCAADGKHTGTGMVTSVSGSSYQLEILSGTFPDGESVWIYRSEDYETSARIGKGTVARKAPVAYTGEGVIIRFPLENGSEVKKGDVLFETLSGSYSGRTGQLGQICVQEDGVIASVSLNAGSTVESGSAVAELYADSRMRVECMVPESELDNFQPGDAVNMEFIYIEDGALTATGRVEKVSRVGSQSGDESEESVYRVQIVPDTTDGLLYGMTAVISRIQTGS